jgi:glycosyltransferase involved in cell wall biosynthesis
MRETRCVVAIGPIPPPTTGFAVITSRMIELLSETHEVHVANVSPPTASRGLRYHATRVTRVLAAAWKLLSLRRVGSVAYIACEGDGGLVYTAFLVFIARVFGYPSYLHHHSFGYIDRPRGLMRAVLRAGGAGLTHIFLCETMADAFRKSYPVSVRHVVISNAAFVTPRVGELSLEDHSHITIGLLSNLNRAKGLHTFLELLRRAKVESLPIRGILAGPLIDKTDEAELARARSELGDILTYRGSLAGEAKDAFFGGIDIFTFPTTYANEAQPTVLFEALAAGNLIISHDRGCIADQVGAHGLVMPREGDFIAATIPFLDELLRAPADLVAKRHAAKDDYRRLHVLMQDAVWNLLERSDDAE